MVQIPAKQFSGIFVSYRRDDSSGHAGRLSDKLVNHFGEDQIFIDIDTIQPGEDFVQVIENAVGSCEILIAVIGRRWLSSTDGVSRRLDNLNDFVRLEINAALNRDIRVIPVLVEGAQMPRPQDLPDELARLARRHALELSDLRWRHDVTQLISVIEKVLAERKIARSIASEEEEARQRQAAETRKLEEAQRRDEEEAAHPAAEARHQREAQVRRKDEERKSQQAEQERKKAEVAEAEQRRKQAEEHARLEAAEKARVGVEAELMRADANERLRLAELNREQEARTAERGRREAKRPALVKTIPAPFVPARPPLSDYPDQSPDQTEDDRARDFERRLATEPKRAQPWILNKRVMAGAALLLVGVLLAGGTGVWWWASNRSPAGMAYVPGGEFMMGHDLGDKYEWPAHRVTVKPFFIDIYEVTREDYKKCVDAHMCRVPQGWSNGSYPDNTQRQPVTGVTLNGAWDYAKWVGKRLPLEEEWEFAARGTDGRRYPWGNEWKPELANADGASNGLAGVGNFKGESPYGVFDMAGNAWEWTASDWVPYPGWTFPPEKVSDDAKVIRGGYYLSPGTGVTTTYRRGLSAQREDDYSNTGFRCVKDLD